MRIQLFIILATIIYFVATLKAMAVDTGQSGSRKFEISLTELNKTCHIHLKPGMKLNDIFSARLPKGSINAFINLDQFIVDVPDIKKLVHQEADDEATFAGKVLDMNPDKNNGKGVTLFRTFYRDSDDTFYLRCQPQAGSGKVFGATYKINNNGTLTKIQS